MDYPSSSAHLNNVVSPSHQTCIPSHPLPAGDADKDQLLSLADIWAILEHHFAGTRSPVPDHSGDNARPVSPKTGKLTREDVARLFAEIDVDGTGAVTWAQFRGHLARQALPKRLII